MATAVFSVECEPGAHVEVRGGLVHYVADGRPDVWCRVECDEHPDRRDWWAVDCQGGERDMPTENLAHEYAAALVSEELA